MAISNKVAGGAPSSYRDRTSEFNAITQRLRKRHYASLDPPPLGKDQETHHHHQKQLVEEEEEQEGLEEEEGLKEQGLDKEEEKEKEEEKPNPGFGSTPNAHFPPPASADFNQRASKIGPAIHEASQRVARLAQLGKRSSMFDDPIVEIQELTALIKQDITTLNVMIADLQTLYMGQIEAASCSEHTRKHYTTIIDNLKSRLMKTTEEFKKVLTVRTENLKVHENRRQLFSSAAVKERTNPFTSQGPFGASRSNAASSSSEPPPWAKRSTMPIGTFESRDQAYTTATSSYLTRRRVGGDTVGDTGVLQSQMQQELLTVKDHAQSNRSAALQNVESTIAELSGVFTQLATMVAHQGELAIRIDENMDDSLTNVEGAQGSLLKYLHRISSNRWLVIKIFIVLVIFLVIFVVFIA